MPRTSSGSPLLVTLGLLAFTAVVGLMVGATACDDGDDSPTRDVECGGTVILRCHWNPSSMRYDRNCVYLPMDAGMGTCDASVGG